MKTVHKYPITQLGEIEVEMPEGSIPIAFQMQGETPTLWCIVDTERPMVKRPMAVVGTGKPLPNSMGPAVRGGGRAARGRHVGTLQYDVFVWHLFDLWP